MSSGFVPIDDLARHVKTLASAESPSEAFRGLLEGARLAAPRAAVFLVRKAQIKGWGCVGYSPEAVQRQRSYTSSVKDGWLGRMAVSSEVEIERREGGGLDPEFGQPAAADAVALPVRVKGRTIALLLAERAGAEEPWFPAVLGLLVNVAQLRLDLDLIRRKLQSIGDLAQPAVTEGGAQPVGTPPAESKEISPVGETESTPADQELEAARRFAKLVATDIRLYNEAAVAQGRRDRDLSRRLADQIARGKETFEQRYGSLGATGLTLLHQAFVEVLAAGDEELLPAPSDSSAATA